MMRRPLLLLLVPLLALGLWQITYAEIHCAFETEESDEACCELCHLSRFALIVCSPPRLVSPTPTFHSTDTLPHLAPLVSVLRLSQGRAPPL